MRKKIEDDIVGSVSDDSNWEPGEMDLHKTVISYPQCQSYRTLGSEKTWEKSFVFVGSPGISMLSCNGAGVSCSRGDTSSNGHWREQRVEEKCQTRCRRMCEFSFSLEEKASYLTLLVRTVAVFQFRNNYFL